MPDWRDPEALARAWHWSEDAPVFEVEVDDPDLPHPLIACGWFAAAHVETADGPRILRCDDENAFLAFDPRSAYGRLYLVLPAEVCGIAFDAFWRGDTAEEVPLGQLAHQVGGRHRNGYPPVLVQPIGPIRQIEYFTRKYGQGAEKGAVFYHPHEHPEPWLAVGDDGRLWYAGGDYDATDLRGIVG